MCARRILVVDDEPIVGAAIRFTLQNQGHGIEVVTNPNEALKRFEVGKYAVILTDFKMEGMTGLQLAEQIKARSPAQVIILVSAFPPAYSESIVDFVIPKPFCTVELRRLVARLVGGPLG